MTKTTTKYKRAKSRAKARSPRRGGANRGWNLAIGVIVVVGVALVALTVRSNSSSAAVSPKVGEHWHAYLGVNVCGRWLGNAPQFENQADASTVRAGIHSHGDGIMHTHPYSSGEAGNNAVVGTFIDYGGWKLSETSMTLWDGKTYTNVKCKGLGSVPKIKGEPMPVSGLNCTPMIISFDSVTLADGSSRPLTKDDTKFLRKDVVAALQKAPEYAGSPLAALLGAGSPPEASKTDVDAWPEADPGDATPY